MTAPVVESPHLETFLSILDRVPDGVEVTVENVRPDIEAAQLPASSLGALFRAAVARGHLTHTGRSAVEHRASRRHGRAAIYVRTTPKETP